MTVPAYTAGGNSPARATPSDEPAVTCGIGSESTAEADWSNATIYAGDGTGDWRIVAALARGTSHVTENLPCQDRAAYWISAPGALRAVAIGVIADGAGSATYADVGAQTAVDTAIAF